MTTHRIQVDLEEEAFKSLQALKKAAGIKKNRDLFALAISVLRWFLKQRAEGAEILVQYPNQNPEKVHFVGLP